MSATKKYLSLERLSEYDALLKAKIAQDDASTLQSAKDYADSLIEDINTSITSGDVVAKAAEHATSADSATTAESATKATQDGNGAVIADTYETKNDAAAKLTEAKEYTDALKTYVGTIPATATATDVIGYVQEKTSGIATSENLQELTNRVADTETDIDNIQKDYLTSTDKTELQTNINTVSSAVELLTNGVDPETVDGVNDLITYVNEHGTEVTGMKADIKANADAIAVLEAINHDAYIAADEALKSELDGDIADLAAALEDAKTDTAHRDAVVLAEAQKASAAVQAALDAHTGDGDIHVTAQQKTAWDKVADKADQTALQAEIDRATAAEQANADAIAAFVEVTEEEINALFA